MRILIVCTLNNAPDECDVILDGLENHHTSCGNDAITIEGIGKNLKEIKGQSSIKITAVNVRYVFLNSQTRNFWSTSINEFDNEN